MLLFHPCAPPAYFELTLVGAQGTRRRSQSPLAAIIGRWAAPLTHAMPVIVTLGALQVLLRARAIETQVTQPTIRNVFLNRQSAMCSLIFTRLTPSTRQCYVVAAAQVGVHSAKRSSYGHAMCVDPWGKVLADAGSPPPTPPKYNRDIAGRSSAIAASAVTIALICLLQHHCVLSIY